MTKLPLRMCLAWAIRLYAGSIASGQTADESADSLKARLLIPCNATMVHAWDLPRNPFRESVPSDSHLAGQIRAGFEIFMDTPGHARRLAGNSMSCNNCHPNGGQKELFAPMVGIAGCYPEYNKRSGRLFSLEDRIVECFMRSINASAVVNSRNRLSTSSPEVLAVAAYLAWLSSGLEVGKEFAWRGKNVIPSSNLISPSTLKLNLDAGRQLFTDRCSNCHGEDGQGAWIGDKRPGPLWGPQSWNDGAGAARTYTLAGMIRYAMPYMDPGSLTDEEALEIAAYITSRPRPKYPFKKDDYQKEKVPVDAVYYGK